MDGNKSTNSRYIQNRLHLHKDRIDNVHELNKDLLRFNSTNDVQLRIFMQAGEEAGTTDYVITAYEPGNTILQFIQIMPAVTAAVCGVQGCFILIKA